MRNEYPVQKCLSFPRGSGLAARWDQLYKQRNAAQPLARSSAAPLPSTSPPSLALSESLRWCQLWPQVFRLAIRSLPPVRGGRSVGLSPTEAVSAPFCCRSRGAASRSIPDFYSALVPPYSFRGLDVWLGSFGFGNRPVTLLQSGQQGPCIWVFCRKRD